MEDVAYEDPGGYSSGDEQERVEEGTEHPLLTLSADAGEGFVSMDGKTDADINTIANELHVNFRDQVLGPALGSMVLLKRKLTAEREKDLAAQKAAAQRLIEAAQVQEKRLLQVNSELRENVMRLEQKVTSIGDKVADLHMRTSQRGPVCKAMSGWHKATMDAQQARAQMAMAKRHSKTLYESRAFGTWKGEVSHSIYERAQMVANQRMEAVTRDIVKRYEKELGQVRAELASALTALSSERSRAHKMEEDMRRALLRGFSAMNMEALSLFGNSSEGTG